MHVCFTWAGSWLGLGLRLRLRREEEEARQEGQEGQEGRLAPISPVIVVGVRSRDKFRYMGLLCWPHDRVPESAIMFVTTGPWLRLRQLEGEGQGLGTTQPLLQWKSLTRFFPRPYARMLRSETVLHLSLASFHKHAGYAYGSCIEPLLLTEGAYVSCHVSV